jgi:GxxExxY protein
MRIAQEDRKGGRFAGDFSGPVIGACIEVHRELGPGLLESAYESCLCYELSLRGISYERQRPVPVRYKDQELEVGYRIDIVVENRLLVEIKSVETLIPIHCAQVITYLRLSGLPVGLLVNFNTLSLKSGLRRLTRDYKKIFRPSDLPV